MVTEPLRCQAGFTLTFKRTIAAYPPGSGWALAYALRKAGSPAIAFTATENGGSYSVTVPPSVTQGWTPGSYRMFGFVTKDDDTRQIYSGEIEVRPDVRDGAQMSDPRGKWTRIADAIESKFEGRATAGELDLVAAAFTGYSAQYSQATMLDLLKFAGHMREEERDQERMSNGEQSARDQLCTFAR